MSSEFNESDRARAVERAEQILGLGIYDYKAARVRGVQVEKDGRGIRELLSSKPFLLSLSLTLAGSVLGNNRMVKAGVGIGVAAIIAPKMLPKVAGVLSGAWTVVEEAFSDGQRYGHSG